MLQITLHLSRSSRLWTLLLLGLKVFVLRSEKKSHSNRFYGDTQRRDVRPFKDNHYYCYPFPPLTW
jgi:hypothetical protein